MPEASARLRTPHGAVSAAARDDRHGAAGAADVPIWEVFRQEREGAPFQHGGSLEAPDRAFAEAYAKEFYGRRAESFALWVVPRESVLEVQIGRASCRERV